MPVWPGHACGLPMRGSCVWTWNFGSVILNLGAMTFDLGGIALTLCAPDGDGSTTREGLSDLVSFLVQLNNIVHHQN